MWTEAELQSWGSSMPALQTRHVVDDRWAVEFTETSLSWPLAAWPDGERVLACMQQICSSRPCRPSSSECLLHASTLHASWQSDVTHKGASARPCVSTWLVTPKWRAAQLLLGHLAQTRLLKPLRTPQSSRHMKRTWPRGDELTRLTQLCGSHPCYRAVCSPRKMPHTLHTWNAGHSSMCKHAHTAL